MVKGSIDKKIIYGEFDLELAEHFEKLIWEFEDKEIKMPIEVGGGWKVLLLGDYALKYTKNYPKSNIDKENKELIHKYDIGTGLKKIGLNIPKMFAVFLGQEAPFLIMERLYLTPTDELSDQNIKEAKRQFYSQIELAKANRFIPGDTSASFLKEEGVFYNYGFDVRKNKGYFFDFSDWKKVEN